MNAAARHGGSARLRRWLRAFAFTFGLALLTALGVADDGRTMPIVVVLSAVFGLGFLYWLFPRGLNFAFGTATGLAIYASLFVVLGRAQFPDAPDWARGAAFLLPVVAFLAMAWRRRAAIEPIVARPDAHDLTALPHTLRWLLNTSLVGLICFLLPLNRMAPAAQGAALLASMAVIATIVALAVRDVVRLLVDVALITQETGERLRHLMVPATAFLLMYALLVIGFAAAYRIADGLSVVALFSGPHGAMRISYSDALHFSIATLSTVGYGDIHPQDDGIRVLSSLQVVAGQLLLLFGVAEILRGRRQPRADAAPDHAPHHAPHDAPTHAADHPAETARRRTRTPDGG